MMKKRDFLAEDGQCLYQLRPERVCLDAFAPSLTSLAPVNSATKRGFALNPPRAPDGESSTPIDS